MALKQAHSELCNCFSNAAIGKNEQIENCNGGRAKYNYRLEAMNERRNEHIAALRAADGYDFSVLLEFVGA